jgi:purine-binding chemotaxis protein CheW
MPRFADLLERFLYRPDEAVGPFLELAPEAEPAARPSPEEVPEEYLAFELAGETYALPIAGVRQILKVGAVTEVPRAEPRLLGLINVRGEMLPLYDVKVGLHLATTYPTVRTGADVPRGTRVVLVRDPGGDAGLLVDRVVGAVKLTRSLLESVPPLGRQRAAVAGLARDRGALYILLDVPQVLG